MKKRMEQLLNGKFEYEITPLQLSEKKIALTAEPGEVLHGSFEVSNPDEKKVRGFLYSSNPRMTFEPDEFFGIVNKIYYQMDTSGLNAGEESEGTFTICTDHGEYQLPYVLQIKTKKAEKPFAITGTKELTGLTKRDFQEAYPLFVSHEFSELIKAQEPWNLPLYEGLEKQSFRYQSLEEYLIGCQEKEPVEISIEESEVQFRDPEQSFRETIVLHKNNWGFMRLDISSDTRFLRVEKKVLTTDEFVGNTFPLEYIIDTNFLHAGRNYGRIKISNCYQSLFFEVTVIKKVESEEKRHHHVQNIMRKKLEMLYVSYRLKKINLQTWVDRSNSVIDSYKRAQGKDVFADLFQVQLLFADDKKTKAYKILQEVEKTPGRLNTPERYGFYLYLSTFFNQDISYVNQVEARIEQIFLQNRDNWALQWILLYLQDRYQKDDSLKLEAVLEQIKCGCCSQIMYLEACQLLKKDPFLLRHLDKLELKVLFFAAKQKALTAELTRQISNLAIHSRVFDRMLYEILQACYEAYPSAELVKAICILLMNGEKKEPEYFAWYELAVDMELKITGLYEYYMETMDQHGIEKMPQIIRMYFLYNNTMDYTKRARIYRSIIENKKEEPQVYHNYRSAMERFAVEQISLGRLNQDLAVLYENCLNRQLLTRTLAEKLAKMLFTFEITCKNPELQAVAVVHGKVKEERVTPLSKGRALVQIYTPDARILLIDGEENRYVSTSLYMAERMLDVEELLKLVLELAPDYPGLLLYVCDQISNSHEVTRQTLPALKKACELEELKEAYRKDLRKWILGYYMEHPEDDTLFTYLKEISYPSFMKADKTALMSLLTQEGMYEEAFALLEQYGSERVPLLHLVRICSQTVLALEYEENPVLLSYCFQCFGFGKYDDNILNYLMMYYDGPVEDMKLLWGAGRQFELDTLALEEKILTLVLFTGNGSAGTEPVFISYRQKLGRRKICKAYLILKSYEYFVRDLPVNEVLFGYLEHSYQNGQELEDVCKLALLQHYSGLVSLKGQQEENTRKLLLEYNNKGMRFAFYQKFPHSLTLPYQLEDKVFIEYVANPDNQVMICWRMKGKQDQYQSEPMQHCFEGIYVKEFVLFAGEELECYTQEILPDRTTRQSDHRVLTARLILTESNSRYELLNRMSKGLQENDETLVRAQLETWKQLDHLTQEVFTLI